LTALKDEQKAINTQIDMLIQGDSRLKELFDLIVSVPGVGAATATEILVATNELKTINDPKKMAASAVRLSCRRCPF
jgi:transposase